MQRAFALAVLLLLAALPARATTMSGTVTGTMASGTDTLNYFGGGDLTGDTITFTYSYDLTGLSVFNAGTAEAHYSTGAAGEAAISITMNGHTVSLATGNGIGGQIFANNTGELVIDLYGTHSTDPRLRVGLIVNENYVYNTSIWSPVTPKVGGYAFMIDGLAYGPNDFMSYQINATPVVDTPEPASLALLATGLAGIAFRRRK